MQAGVQLLGCGKQRHAVRLGALHGAALDCGRGQRLGRLVLGADDVGGKFQVIGNRVAAGQLAQAGGAFKKQAADVRRQHAREGGVVQRLDLAGLQDAS